MCWDQNSLTSKPQQSSKGSTHDLSLKLPTDVPHDQKPCHACSVEFSGRTWPWEDCSGSLPPSCLVCLAFSPHLECVTVRQVLSQKNKKRHIKPWFLTLSWSFWNQINQNHYFLVFLHVQCTGICKIKGYFKLGVFFWEWDILFSEQDRPISFYINCLICFPI